MAMFYQRARRVAWDSQSSDKSRSGSISSKDSSSSEKPQKVQRLPRSAELERFSEALKKDGCVIVEDFTDMKTLERANREIDPWLQRLRQDDMKEDGKQP